MKTSWNQVKRIHVTVTPLAEIIPTGSYRRPKPWNWRFESPGCLISFSIPYIFLEHGLHLHINTSLTCRPFQTVCLDQLEVTLTMIVILNSVHNYYICHVLFPKKIHVPLLCHSMVFHVLPAHLWQPLAHTNGEMTPSWAKYPLLTLDGHCRTQIV